MIKKASLGFLSLIAIGTGLYFTPYFAHIRNYVLWGKHTIHDYKTHPFRIVENGDATQSWVINTTYNKK